MRNRLSSSRALLGALLTALLTAGLVLASSSARADTPETPFSFGPGGSASLTFAGIAGQWVTPAMTGVTRTAGDFGLADLTMAGPDGVPLGSDRSYTGTAQFDVRLPASGTYTVRVTTDDPASGFSGTFGVANAITGNVAFGGAPSSVTSTRPGQLARLGFTVPATQDVTVGVSGEEGKLPKFAVESVASGELVNACASGSSPTYASDRLRLPAGQYVLLLDPPQCDGGNTRLFAGTVRVQPVRSVALTLDAANRPAATTVPAPRWTTRSTSPRGTARRTSGCR